MEAKGGGNHVKVMCYYVRVQRSGVIWAHTTLNMISSVV